MEPRPIQLNPHKITEQGSFVYVKKGKKHFEIGIIKEVELRQDHKELKVMILTDAAFPNTLAPKFDVNHPPFLPNGAHDVALDLYPLYPINTGTVIELLSTQLVHLEHEVRNREILCNNTDQKTPAMLQDKKNSIANLEAFKQLKSCIRNLRNLRN